MLTAWGARVVVRQAATNAGSLSLATTDRQPLPPAVGRIATGPPWHRFARLPRARLLETTSYPAVLVGFPLLGLGIALGAYWGNIAWGRYWGWDPKETTALVTWLVFAGYLHARSLGGWRGRRAAFIVVLGWAIITFN